ncbi:MAG: DNA repair protein RecN [Alkalispirochaetaceae bacterium]
MLEELSVRNYALVENLSLSLSEGFTVLTGETGAGKSLLLGALSVILGGKAEVDAIRAGKEEAIISGVFNVGSNREAGEWLDERDIAAEEGAVIVRRTVKRQGRGGIYIQNVPVTRSDLAEFAELLVDLHSQHEHQSLFNEENHRKLLDRYAECEELAGEVRRRFIEIGELRRRLEALSAKERDRARELELLEFAVKEIEGARLQPGEEEQLHQEKQLLGQYERLHALVEEFQELMNESRGGAIGTIRKSRSLLNGISEIDGSLSELAGRLESAFFEVEDIVDSVRDYASTMAFDPGRLEECESRLAQIHRLEKKYGPSVEEVLAYAEHAREEIDRLSNAEAHREDLSKRIGEEEQELYRSARDLSARRTAAAGKLQGEIEGILRTLAMEKAHFTVRVEQKQSERGRPVCGPAGIDKVAFMIAPNPGEPSKPLTSIASGGEISRVMLAIKSILAASDTVTTLVFDEVDTGVGGEVAVALGEHLARLAEHRQVIAITHIASIAARASGQIRIEKELVEEKTVVSARLLDQSERISEIARMLSGDKEAEVSLNHAKELLSRYTMGNLD